MQDTIRLTVAQAILRWLVQQFIDIDGVETRICGGGFGIFGHGNVPCLGEALYPLRDELPCYRGQNEQSMGFAAAAYAKYHLRRRFMFCTASAGPGTANLLTAAALAHANRLPMLMLCGDTFLTRLPDPVLQQLEHFGNPALGLNDAFKAVSRYWDRITHPAQILQSLPAALATMLDPADCGPAFIGLPQDLQLVGQQTAPEFLDFAWWVLWSGAKRPDPSGRWSSRPTKQELAQAQAQMAQIQRQVDQLAGQVRPALERDLRAGDAQWARQQAAAEIRKGRAMSRNERLMLTAWEGRPESEVAATMGAPVVSEAGGLRFLSYGREFDNRVVVGNRQGAVWEEGVYEHCNVQFVLHAPDGQVARVADVRIWTGANRIGQVVFACTGLLEAPR